MTSPRPEPRIFVQIASYRDPECHHTITDLFKKAGKPDRITVGVCWQLDPEEDGAFIKVPYPREAQVRVKQFHVKDAQGAGWARNEAQSLWRGEEYILQIQAHMRFEAGWDETLIELLESCPSEKPVLTAWLPGYVPPDRKLALNGQIPLSTVNRLGGREDAQIVHLIKRLVPAESLLGKHIPTCSWVGNFMFTHASTLQEVPFDPYIYFWGEEINYSARLWTHGYDIFHLDRVVLYHYWDRAEAKDSVKYRNHHIEANRLSLERNNFLLGLATKAGAKARKNIEKYPLGTERTLEDYWRFAGYDLVAGTISRKAREGNWALDDSKSKTTLMPRIFVAIASYRDPEISHTIKDMFAKASRPERIFAGVCLQVDPEKDRDSMVHTSRPKQVRILQVHYEESKGANWGRAKAHTLRRGEEYVLQIDSHMRFEKGWDNTLIDMLSRCPAEKPVISGYLPNYEPPDERDYPITDEVIRLKVRKLGGPYHPQLVHVTGIIARKDENGMGGLYPSPFCTANFLFSRAQTFDEVPVDPYFQFFGDEISHGARLWTHGYDIFQPDKLVLFHYWVRMDTVHLHLHYRETRTEKSKLSMRRVKHLLGFEHTTDLEAIRQLEQYHLGSARPLEDWWSFAGINWKNRSIAKKALEGQWLMAAREKAIKKSKEPKLPRIFVQIPSYRDLDCQYTVKDLFEKAAHPERIFVGICWQTIKGKDDDCFKVAYPYPKQVRVQEVDAKKGKGVCWARSLTQKLWEGEEYTLQIDSHMRFAKGWDDTLIEMQKECGADSVITAYPPAFTPPDKLDKTKIHGMGAKKFDESGILLFQSVPTWPVSAAPDKPMPGAFISGCMLFGPSSIITDVPYDPNIYFFGEEVSLAARLWTHGYNIFHPNKQIVYHDWERSKRRTHFDDHMDWPLADRRSRARVKHLLGSQQQDDPEITKDLDQYGLGSERSLEEYQRYSGVDFKNYTISMEASRGEYEAYKKPAGKPMRGFAIGRESAGKNQPRIFVNIASYRDRECQWTVQDLFEKAKYPDRINVGICWQFDEEDDKDCFKVSTRPEQVRIIPVDWREGEGVSWARNLTQQLWDGEEYNLQIDAHTRFVPAWDQLMIDELHACEADKPVISCNPASYWPPNKLQERPSPAVRRVQPFTNEGNLRGKGESLNIQPEKPLNGAFIAAGFVFSKSDIVTEVPYDPYMYFDQEEISYAARLYTYGWDVFSARHQMLYHYYNVDKETVRPLHWRDLRQEDEKRIVFLRERGLKRFNHLTGFKLTTDPDVLRELSSYGFGTVRTLKDFEDYSGVDFKNKIATDKALRCGFIKDLYKYRKAPIYVPEIDGPNPPPPQAVNAQPKSTATQLDMPADTKKAAAATPAPKPAAPAAAIANWARPPFEKGDFIPSFEMRETTDKVRNLETAASRPNLIWLLPSRNGEYIKKFFELLPKLIEPLKIPIWQSFIVDDTLSNLMALKTRLNIGYNLMADPERKTMQNFGLCKSGETNFMPTVFVTSRNLKIQARISGLSPEDLITTAIEEMRKVIGEFHAKNAKPQIITEVPPMLIVPDAFTDDFCQRCIESFKTGHTFEGTVGGGEKTAYRPDTKIRTDHILTGQLLEEVDDKLSRSLFPEIRKIFGFEVSHREMYKVGLYTGEKGGFFKPHRDNYDPVLSYRRVAMTLHLTDDFDGGGLRFPEYSENVFRPAKGAAIAFSCGTMHEAMPVTRGDRYVLVGFFHGQQDEAWRRHYMASRNEPVKIKPYTPALRDMSALKRSRDFYRKWMAENVSFDRGETVGPVTSDQNQVKAPILPAEAATPTATRPNMLVTTLGTHQARKVFESKQAVILDDFLPEDLYQSLYHYAVESDYERINTQGKSVRAWHLNDGFPLRGTNTLFYYPKGASHPQKEFLYPTGTKLDTFVDYMQASQPHVSRITGQAGKDWEHFTVSSWLYPHGTSLSLHSDGAGVYTGAFVYFLNPVWKSHWGGQLILADEGASQRINQHKETTDQSEYYRRTWLKGTNMEELLFEDGLGQCIFPKRNRMVYIANDAYHMVTRVNEASGDNIRLSLAGFFKRKKQ